MTPGQVAALAQRRDVLHSSAVRRVMGFESRGELPSVDGAAPGLAERCGDGADGQPHLPERLVLGNSMRPPTRPTTVAERGLGQGSRSARVGAGWRPGTVPGNVA